MTSAHLHSESPCLPAPALQGEPTKGKATARLKVGEGLVDSVDHCEIEPYATPMSG